MRGLLTGLAAWASIGMIALAGLAAELAPASAPPAPLTSPASQPAPVIKATRLASNPIIRQGMPHLEGRNTNGPSLVLAPPWLDKPLGKYYLYFADHRGKSIMLATADDLSGPWSVHEGGVLHLAQTPCKGHIASPDVHVDAEKKEVRMYFHGPAKAGGGQLTFLATSADGLAFKSGTEALGPSYFAVFQHGGWFYTVTKRDGEAGYIFRSRDGVTPFEKGPALIPRMRHSGAKVEGDTLYLFYTRIGDAPERILATRIDLRQEWNRWKDTMSPPAEVLKPETEAEGAKLPLAASASGPARGPCNQLRDPAIFEEKGRTYLVYSIAGENGLAIAELSFEAPSK